MTNTMNCPEIFKYHSVDEIAECIPGITPETYRELWECLERAVESGTAKPMGGDGSDGTTEEPIVSSGEYGSDLPAVWQHLSEEARRNICACAAAH